MHINQTVITLAISKRDAESDAEYEKAMQEIDDRKSTCKGLEYAGHVTGLVTDLIGDIPEIPLVTDVLKIATSGIAAVAHVAEFGMNIAATALECDDVNFDEIKLIMEKRFNEVDRKLDKLTQAMEKVTEIVTKTLDAVEKTRTEMNWGFKQVLATLKNMEIQSILSRINKFSRYFERKSNELSKLPADEFVFQLKEENGILDYLNKAQMPEGLHSDLFELMDKSTKFSIPENTEDTKAFQALYALFYGTQTYASVMFFLLKQHSYLADYYYQSGEDVNFNEQFDHLKKVFHGFKTALTGSNGLINEVIKTLEDVKELEFIKNVKNDLYADICMREDSLKDVKTVITEMEIDVIVDVPQHIDNINFKEPIVVSNYGDWDDKSKVRYAVQLRENGTYSKFSEWTEPLKIEGKANPVLQVPRDENRRERLVFRKFNEEKPQLVGILTKSQVEFRDINRDLYNAARSKDQNRTLEYIPTLLEAGANVHATFEMRRTVMHAAAESGNVKIALRYLLEEVPVDSRDEKGFTPMHIAVDTKNAGFVNFLITHNANVNAQTNLNKLTPLHLAAKKGYSNVIKNLLASNEIKINQREKSGYTPLHYAVRGTVKAIKALLSKKHILVNAKSDFGLTPFHLAVMKGDREICDALLSSGKVEVNAGNKNNMTPLHFAAMAGNVDMIQYLLSGKKEVEDVNINAVTSDNNWTPLEMAIYFEKTDAALELLKNPKVDTSINSKEYITPLHLSVATGQAPIFDELLKKESRRKRSMEPEIEAKTKEGYTALHLAALRDDTSYSKELLSKGANKNATSNDASTPLHLAAKSDKHSEIMFLLQNGANMRLYNNDNYLAIHYAIKNVNSEAVREFRRQEKSIIQSSNDDGMSVMTYAMDFIKLSFYHYYRYRDLAEYRKYKDLQPKQVFEKLGYYDLIRALLDDNPEEHDLKCSILFANAFALLCIKNELKSEKPPCPNMTLEALSPQNLRNNFKRQIETADYFLENPHGDSYSFSHAKSSPTQHIDLNGSLLLLDLLFRKMTNEKLRSNNVNQSSHSIDPRALALEITDSFSKYINAVSVGRADEVIDFAKLHSDLFKAIKVGKYNKIGNILRSHAKGLVDPTDEDFYLSVILPSDFNEAEQSKKEYFKSFAESCGVGPINFNLFP